MILALQINLEYEDMESLRYFDTTQLQDLDREIVEDILESGQFSAEMLAKRSMKHACRYLELCNTQNANDMGNDLIDYVVMVVNRKEKEESYGKRKKNENTEGNIK